MATSLVLVLGDVPLLGLITTLYSLLLSVESEGECKSVVLFGGHMENHEYVLSSMSSRLSLHFGPNLY